MQNSPWLSYSEELLKTFAANFFQLTVILCFLSFISRPFGRSFLCSRSTTKLACYVCQTCQTTFSPNFLQGHVSLIGRWWGICIEIVLKTRNRFISMTDARRTRKIDEQLWGDNVWSTLTKKLKTFWTEMPQIKLSKSWKTFESKFDAKCVWLVERCHKSSINKKTSV